MRTDSLSCEKNKCCGCKLCGNMCPKGAIYFSSDKMGFEYPVIDESRCVDCHKCERVCPIRHMSGKNAHTAAYAAVNKDVRQLSKSASGGVFSAIADVILEEDGVVYGCAMQKDDMKILKAMHIRAADKEHMKPLYGSKYVQSDMGEIYNAIEEDLNVGKTVLFSGVPCQVAAVKKKFGDISNLLLVELICHGVPSQQMFTDYLKVLARKSGKSVERFMFKTKENKSGLYARVEIKGRFNKVKSRRIPCGISSFYSMFVNGDILRDSCYECKFAAKERIADLTIGDYWGIENIKDLFAKCIANDYDMVNGISCVLVNTEKGLHYLKEANLELFESDYDSVAKENHQLYRASAKPDLRERIMQEYITNGYADVEKKFNRHLGWRKYRIWISDKVTQKLKVRLREILKK